MNIKNGLFVTILVFLLFCIIYPQKKAADKNRWLIFEGEITRIGPPPGVLCGVLSPYRLAEYKVEKIYHGKFNEAKIIVDHLYCSEEVLEDVAIGDKVIVIIDLFQLPAERWYDDVLRGQSEKDKVKIYIASRVSILSKCCDF